MSGTVRRANSWYAHAFRLLAVASAGLLLSGPASAGLVLLDENGNPFTLPDLLARNAQGLLEEYQAEDVTDLKSKDILGALCATFTCLNLSEEQASKLLAIHLERLKADEQKSQKVLDFALKFFSSLLSLVAIIISYLGYRKSKQTAGDAKSTRTPVQKRAASKGKEE